jgi:hypothetical protein
VELTAAEATVQALTDIAKHMAALNLWLSAMAAAQASTLMPPLPHGFPYGLPGYGSTTLPGSSSASPVASLPYTAPPTTAAPTTATAVSSTPIPYCRSFIRRG